jgi:hypothetical protein
MQITTNVGKHVEKKEPSYTACRNVNYYNHYKRVWRLLKTLKINLLFHPAILPLGIYPKEYKSDYNKVTCTSMFIAALIHLC